MWNHRYVVASSKTCLYFVLFFATAISAFVVTPAYAEVDPAVLNAILNQLAGDHETATGTTTSTGTTTVTSTGTTTTTTPPASANSADHLEISMSPTGKIWENTTITIQAKNKSNEVASSYRGTVTITVANDTSATVPYVNGYTFNSTDQGKKTFSIGLTFSKAGTFTVSAADVSYPNISGNSSIVIEGNPVTNIPPTPTVSLVPTAVTPTSTPILPTTTTTPSEISTASPSPTFTIVKLETGDKKVTVTFRVTNDTADIQKFEFNYVDQAGARNKAVTFPKEQIRKDTGDYVWYIPNLSVSKYTLSIAGIGNNGETITGAVSKPFTADLSLLSPEKCTIPTVSGVKLSVQQGKSILSWDSIPEAIRYKVYKKNSNGNYVFVEDTPNINYTIYVSDGVVRYDEFSIRAVCSDGTESTAYSPSTLIQTWPSKLAILWIISLLVGFTIIKKRKNFANSRKNR